MKRTLLAFSLILAAASRAHADGQATEIPVVAQFREHMKSADQNGDGFVTKEELTAEVSKNSGRSPEAVAQVVGAMMLELDADHDGKLSPAEIADGMRKTKQNFITKQDVERAQRVMEALAEYAKQQGRQPAKLEALTELHLIPDTALRCIMADGQEKPWGYAPGDKGVSGPNSVVLFSPGGIDLEGQYLVGLRGGKVLGLHDTELRLEKVPVLKMKVYPDE